MQIGRKLFSNTVYLFFDWFSLTLFGFLFWFIAAKTLPPEGYGIVATAVSFITLIVTFTSLGIGSAINKLIPEFLIKRNIKGAYSLIKFSIKPLFIILVPITFFLLLFSQNLSTLLKMPLVAFIICVFSIFFSSFFSLFHSILLGFQNMKKCFLVDSMFIFIRIVVSLILVFIGFHYYGFLIGIILSLFLGLFLIIDRNYFKSTTSTSHKKLLYYAIPAFIAMIATTLVSYTPNLILTVLKNPGITGIFAVAFTLSNIISVVPSVFTQALFPIISGLSVKRDSKTQQSYLIALIFRYALFLILPISFLLLLFSKYAVLLFSKYTFIGATSYLTILVPAALFSGMGSIFLSNIYATGKPKTQRNILIIVAVVFLLLSIPLTKYFSAIGLSFSYLSAMILLFLLSFLYIRKFIGLKLFISDIFKVILSSIIVASILFFLRPFIHNIVTLVLVSIPVALLYLSLLFLLKFYREEDIKILEFFAERMPKNIVRYFYILINFLSKYV
jgi:stage V sporulation protein B